MRACVVGDAKGPDDELAGTDSAHLAADLDDDPAILMAHVHRAVHLLEPPVGPQVRAANARRRQLDDGVGRKKDFGIGDFLAADIARAMKNGCAHEAPSRWPYGSGSDHRWRGALRKIYRRNSPSIS